MKKFAGRWIEIECPVPYCRAFTWGFCQVFVGKEPSGKNGEMLWHLSISCLHRYPTWDEIRTARYDFIPDKVYMAMILPPKKDYVNVHQNCFHLHELAEQELNLCGFTG